MGSSYHTGGIEFLGFLWCDLLCLGWVMQQGGRGEECSSTRSQRIVGYAITLHSSVIAHPSFCAPRVCAVRKSMPKQSASQISHKYMHDALWTWACCFAQLQQSKAAAIMGLPDSVSAPHPESVWAHLPKEILESVGLYLDAAGWRNGRLVCKAWAKSVTACIHLLEIDLERDAHRYGGAIRATRGGPTSPWSLVQQLSLHSSWCRTQCSSMEACLLPRQHQGA